MSCTGVPSGSRTQVPSSPAPSGGSISAVPARSSAPSTASSEPGRTVNETWCRRLTGSVGHPDLLLVAAWALGGQRARLLGGLQAEVPQEAVGDLQVRHFERIVVKS